jgi:hypothetical protein
MEPELSIDERDPTTRTVETGTDRDEPAADSGGAP